MFCASFLANLPHWNDFPLRGFALLVALCALQSFALQVFVDDSVALVGAVGSVSADRHADRLADSRFHQIADAAAAHVVGSDSAGGFFPGRLVFVDGPQARRHRCALPLPPE